VSYDSALKKIGHETACLPPEVPRGRDKVHDCTTMDAHSVSPIRLPCWPESSEFRHRQNGVHKDMCRGKGDLCGLNPPACVNGKRDLADRAHTQQCTALIASTPHPRVFAHRGHLRVLASWSYQEKRKQQGKTGTCSNQRASHSSMSELASLSSPDEPLTPSSPLDSTSSCSSQNASSTAALTSPTAR